ARGPEGPGTRGLGRCEDPSRRPPQRSRLARVSPGNGLQLREVVSVPVHAAVPRVDPREMRAPTVQLQDVRDPESGIAGIQGVEHGPDRLVVFAIVDGPPMRPREIEARLPRDVAQAETAGSVPEKRSRVLSLVVLAGLQPCDPQSLERKD